ncbi:MAG: hypothetical protein HN368_22320 [Spirochaetales bacterium]|nr:hypothetical protein [Spirochaetales bacterium]
MKPYIVEDSRGAPPRPPTSFFSVIYDWLFFRIFSAITQRGEVAASRKEVR